MAEGASFDDAGARLPVLLRTAVIVRARSAIIPSRFETEHSADEAHVHRLAYLRALGKTAPDANQLAGVRSDFERLRDRRAEDGAALRFAVSAIVLTTAIGIAGGAAYVFTRPEPMRHEDWSEHAEEVPEIAEAEAPPPHPLTPFFTELLPAYVVALDARSVEREPAPPRDVASTRSAAIAALTAHATSSVEAFTSLLAASESFSGERTAFADQVWLERLVLFHDALAEADAPFYVDAVLTSEGGRNPRRRVLLSTYRVLSRPRFEVTLGLPAEAGPTEPTIVRALYLERLDSLNFTQSLLGYTRPEIRYALVLLDRIEGFLITQHLPSMYSADESVFVRGYEDERDAHWVTEFEIWAHEDLADEARLAIRARGRDPDGLALLAEAIVQRRHAIDAMTHALRSRGIEIFQPRTYDFDTDHIERFRVSENAADLSRVRQAESVLSRPDVRALYDAVLDAFTASVAEHEVQHRIDYEADRLVHVPEMLAEYTGETEFEDRVNHLAERANAELSAYLSQIARAPAHARTALLHVASFVMSRDEWRRPEAYAALVVFEALARAIELPHGPLVVRRRIMRAEIAAIYGALRTRADLAALASTAWSQLYGVPLPSIERLDD
jgi:hypothetical protein